MKQQEQINYDRIAEAIDFIRGHFQSQPSLEEVAEQIHLSPYHFQRLFTDWAGVSPKKFLQYVSVEHAKEVLKDQRATVYDAAFETGLSGTGRLHDLFVSIEGMTPGEFRNGGADLEINYSFAESPFGAMLVASTVKGICYMAFVDEAAPSGSGEPAAFADLRARFPNARFRQITDLIQQNALYIFTQDWSRLAEIKLHLKGTDFQLKVWETLLKIPMGGLTTYKDIAGRLGNPQASRAVGSAVGDNPVAFLIPCHRVIQSTGIIGEYHWGTTRKTAMIGWEAARTTKTA
ncbi:MAG TPA: methylated-DNA--[protein]-cysteine S-methyltransferase [Puia sp.]|jgi:AraC family transcriptional regulator of adaptative response/methylated-DNA-[protein]-cysteine methyltransferase|nr:methylated-DNA--[protein]-cysteine S-methyltransferase [Puia sp.]